MPATHVTHVLSRANFAPLARLQDYPELSRRAIRNVMRSTLLLSGPVSVLIYAATPEYVAHVVGPKWAPIIPLVRILVVAGFLRSFAAIAGLHFNAMGRPELNFRMQIPRFFALVLLVWPLSAHFGIQGACWAALISISACLLVWFPGMRELAQLGALETLKENALSLAVSALLAAACFGLRPLFGVDVASSLLWLGSSIAAWAASVWLLGKLTPLDAFAELGKLRETAKGKA